MVVAAAPPFVAVGSSPPTLRPRSSWAFQARFPTKNHSCSCKGDDDDDEEERVVVVVVAFVVKLRGIADR